jgi:hypothetical protein
MYVLWIVILVNGLALEIEAGASAKRLAMEFLVVGHIICIPPNPVGS